MLFLILSVYCVLYIILTFSFLYLLLCMPLFIDESLVNLYQLISYKPTSAYAIKCPIQPLLIPTLYTTLLPPAVSESIAVHRDDIQTPILLVSEVLDMIKGQISDALLMKDSMAVFHITFQVRTHTYRVYTYEFIYNNIVYHLFIYSSVSLVYSLLPFCRCSSSPTHLRQYIVIIQSFHHPPLLLQETYHQG